MTKQGTIKGLKERGGYGPGPRNDITDVPGVGVGNAVDQKALTGVTVIVPSRPMVCAVDVRGGGPGTRETDLLDPATLVQTVDAIILSGGSTYGLAAADAVTARLGAAGRGFALVERPGVPRSPIVPGAILYDLANGGDKSWGQTPPYHRLGAAAYDIAISGKSPLEQGAVGAGIGARAGAERGGLGSVSVQTPDAITIGALMAVNSFGSVRMPGSKSFWAWPFELAGEFGDLQPDPAQLTKVAGFPEDTKLGPLGTVNPRENTTIGVVAVSVPLTQTQAKRVAIMAQDGMARAIRPVHAPTDGDVIFVLAPDPETTPNAMPADPLLITRLGTHAADCVARAIARAVFAASGQ